jgi:hypothetical protein
MTEEEEEEEEDFIEFCRRGSSKTYNLCSAGTP